MASPAPSPWSQGGTRGIGAAISARLAAEGARVAIGYIEDPDEAASLADRLSGDGAGCLAVACDVTAPASVGSAIEGIERNLGPVTVLVNNAGILVRNEFLDIDESRWDRVLQVSLYGSYRCARAVVQGMLREGRGTIVNVASELVDLGAPMHAHYVAAKSGVVGLTRALARELGPRNIRVPPYDVYPPDPSWVPPAGALSSPRGATEDFGEHLVDRFVALVTSALEREFR